MNQFFIINGTQLINAVEYIHQDNLSKELNELVVLSSKKKICSDLESTLSLYSWSKVTFAFPSNLLNLKNNKVRNFCCTLLFKVKYQKLINRRAKRIVLGNFQNIYCKKINKVTRGITNVVVDDGPNTGEYNPDKPFKGSLYKSILHLILGVYKWTTQPEIIFSSYSKDIKAKPSKTILLENNYRFLQKSSLQKEKGDDIYFLGYPLVEEKAISLSNYMSLLSQLTQKYPSINYLPHRREQSEKLNELKQVIKINSPGVPFELFLCNNTKIPQGIIGFFSTALLNTSKMFGSSLPLYHIELINYSSPHVNNTQNLYQKINEVSKKIIEIDLDSTTKNDLICQFQ